MFGIDIIVCIIFANVDLHFVMTLVISNQKFNKTMMLITLETSLKWYIRNM